MIEAQYKFVSGQFLMPSIIFNGWVMAVRSRFLVIADIEDG